MTTSRVVDFVVSDGRVNLVAPVFDVETDEPDDAGRVVVVVDLTEDAVVVVPLGSVLEALLQPQASSNTAAAATILMEEDILFFLSYYPYYKCPLS